VEIDPIIKSGAFVSLYRVDKTGLIDVADIQKRIDASTKMIYITHYFGFPQPLESVRKICKEKGIYLLEDCALSLFSNSNKDIKIGSTGDISVFSFPKTLPIPDGGSLQINNPALVLNPPRMSASPHWMVFIEFTLLFKHFVLHKIPIAKALYIFLRDIIIKHPAFREITDDFSDSFPDMPHSYYYDENLSRRKISMVSKYMLKHWDYIQIVQKRRRNFQKYLDSLKGMENIKFLFNEMPEGICPLHFPIIINNPKYICRQLHKFSIDTLPWWSGYHKKLPWSDYPEACYLKSHVLALPVHQQLKDKHIDYIIQKLVKIMNESK
jgi:perosamine synthetase